MPPARWQAHRSAFFYFGLPFGFSGLFTWAFTKTYNDSQKGLPSIILNAQIVNSVVGSFVLLLDSIVWYHTKTNLFIYLLSFALILLWRRYGVCRYLIFVEQQDAVLIGSGSENAGIKT